MGFQRSIALPIIGLILVLISVTTLIHYYIQVESLKATFYSRNRDKAEQVHFMIQSIINMENEKLEALSHLLKENQQVCRGIPDYIRSGENIGFLRAVVDSIFQRANVDVLEVIGRDGRVIYRPYDPERKGDYTDHWGVEEALEGRDIISTSHSAEGWGITAFVPLVTDETVVGAIMLGSIINDDYAKRLSQAAGVDISIGTMNGLIATSTLTSDSSDTDFKTLILSLTENRQILVEDNQAGKVILYAPLKIVDENFAFVVEVDTSEDASLLEQNKKQILRLFVIILLIALVIGVGLTLYLIRPLRKLTGKTAETVRNISGDTLLTYKGNEINQLVDSFDLMIQTVTDHLAERKKAEKKLFEEKERLSITLRSIGDAVIATDTQGRIQMFNEAAENLTGWSHNEVIGKPLEDIYRTIDEETHSPGRNPVKVVMMENGDIGLADKTLFTARDGSERVILESGAPIIGESGETFGVVLVFRDITQQKKQEEARIKAHQLESLGTLAGGIAHDFNNILTAILGNASLASIMIPPESKASGNLKEIERATNRAKKLTQKLLTFSKGGAPIRQTEMISDLIRDSAEFILSGTNTKCNFSMVDNLWSAFVDKRQISQVVQNLCLNAHEAMREGGTIDVGAENVNVSEQDNLPLRSGEYIKVTITDHGRGISPVDIPKIYDPYFSTKREGGGLGLSIVHSVVERHGGYIGVHSELDKGTTFTFYIPAINDEVRGKEDMKTQSTDKLRGRILFMDDEKMLRDVVSKMLETMGFQVAVASNGEEAIALFSEEQAAGSSFDAVILDLTIPGGMGGREALKKLISMDPDVIAIVASGYSNDPIVAEFNKHGFKGAIIKPFDTEKLKETVNEVLGLR